MWYVFFLSVVFIGFWLLVNISFPPWRQVYPATAQVTSHLHNHSSQGTVAGLKENRMRTSKVDKYKRDLGRLPDSAVARKAGVTTEAVRQRRIKLGIPGFYDVPPEERPEASAPVKRGGGKASVIDKYAALLGKVPDKDLAAKAGVTVSAVYQYRKHRGIPKYTAQESLPLQLPLPPKGSSATDVLGPATNWTTGQPREKLVRALSTGQRVPALAPDEVVRLAAVISKPRYLFRVQVWNKAVVTGTSVTDRAGETRIYNVATTSISRAEEIVMRASPGLVTHVELLLGPDGRPEPVLE